MTPDQALERVERMLGLTPHATSRPKHYRQIQLPSGRMLAVDIFRKAGCHGHIRIHIWDVDPAAITDDLAASAPVIAPNRRRGCSACAQADLRMVNPRLHVQSDPAPRRYNGFEWHRNDGPSEEDLRNVERAVVYLRRTS
jgi:hypothetical protein